MTTIKSITGKIIRLPDERWLHIIEGHPEMIGYFNEVLLTVAAPELVLQGRFDELLATISIRQTKWLIVVYKENQVDGFILTAYFTSKIDKLLKRTILWQK